MLEAAVWDDLCTQVLHTATHIITEMRISGMKNVFSFTNKQ